MRLITVLLIACFYCLSVTFSSANEGTEVVVTVNGVDLTKAELNQEISKIIPMERSFHGGVSEEKQLEIKKKGMEVLIETELQYQDGVAKGQKLDKKELEREIDLLAAKFPVKEAFWEAVQNAGFSEPAMERFVSRNIIAKRMKELEVNKKVKVTDEMVASYYEENKGKYSKPEEFRASIILIKVPPSSLPEQREEFKKKSDDIYMQFKNGASFEELATKYSDDLSRIKGGDLGYFHAGQADDQDFDAQIRNMKVGEISGILKSLKGYYMVKLTDKKPARQLPFEDVKDKIRPMLVNSEKARFLTEWMGNLKKKAKIVYPLVNKTDKGSNS
ncbi:chaperone SurA [Geobacter sp. OR-1]|uniref:peptidylprolyl isomerase n=1 Tax=Geobacter sp. OR-1 TaxID=1266765 RepID=UPI0005442EB9|nr:peptidylprolyl isomerase [Geobacter sp. OR-1]GAM10661.1 chaperone SurA [Geobacter sp. OR-1]